MKKKIFLVILCILTISLSSCKGQEQEAFEHLFGNEYFSCYMEVSTEFEKFSETKYYGTMSKTPEGFFYYDNYAGYKLICALDRDLLLQSCILDKFGLYSKASSVMNLDVNIEDYFVKKVYGPDIVYARFDLYNYIKALNPVLLSPYITEENGIIETQLVLENGIIRHLSLDFTNIKQIFTDSDNVKKITIILKNFEYNEKSLPSYDLFYYD